jgi:hypothetical protein
MGVWEGCNGQRQWFDPIFGPGESDEQLEVKDWYGPGS